MKTLKTSLLIITVSITSLALAQNNGNNGGGPSIWKLDGNSINVGDFIGTLNNEPIIFKSNGTEGFRLSNTGNLGVGTNTPQTKLDVNGDANVTSNLTVNTSLFHADATNGRVGIGTNNPFNEGRYAGDAQYASKLFIKTTADTYGWSHSDGTVEVASWIGSSSNPAIGGGQIGTISNHNFSFFANCINYMTLTKTGNLGVGTANPSEKLEVQGNTKLNGNLALIGNFNATNGVTFADNTTQTTAANLTGGSDATFVNLDVTNRIKVGNNSLWLAGNPAAPGSTNEIFTTNAPLTINGAGTTTGQIGENTYINPDNGMVGIGTNAPGSKLHVVGNARIDDNVQVGSGTFGKIDVGVSPPIYVIGGGVEAGSCRIDAYGDPNVTPVMPGQPTPHNGGLILNGKSNNAVTIGNPIDKQSNLNVHGKTYISESLEALGLVAFGTKLSNPWFGARLNDPNSKAGQWYNMFVKDGIMMSRSSAAIYFRRGDGTGQPTTQVNGDVAMCLEDRPSGDASFNSSTDPILGLNWFNPYPAQAAGGNWQMFISSSPSSAGFVGLGTPYPTARLSVNAVGAEKVINVAKKSDNTDVFRVMGDGVVYATRVRVMDAANFPDYVFDTSYELMPLTQLENYITKNKHLPNMPTANEVEKEGMDLGEVNRVLVEKVEELTLYMIAMDKRMAQLEEENKELKK